MVHYPEATPRPSPEEMEEHFKRYKAAVAADKTEQEALMRLLKSNSVLVRLQFLQ